MTSEKKNPLACLLIWSKKTKRVNCLIFFFSNLSFGEDINHHLKYLHHHHQQVQPAQHYGDGDGGGGGEGGAGPGAHHLAL